MYHLLDNVISATVGLVYINLQPEYELPNSTSFGLFWKFGKIRVGASFSPATSKETFCTWSEFLFVAAYASNLTFLALLTAQI